MAKTLPTNPNLEFDKKQAKALLKAYRAGDSAAMECVRASHPRLENVTETSIPPEEFKLSDAQLVIARKYGFSSWPSLKHEIEARRAGLTEAFNQFVRAVKRGDTAGVRELLDATPALKEHIDDPVIDFDAPAVIVAAGRSREVLDVLLEHGANINAKSAWWAGAFGVLHGRDKDTAHYLIERGAQVDVHAAAEQGMMDLLRVMISADPALVHAKGPDGQRPLHFAPSTEVIDFLLENGADINARDVDHCGTAAQWMVGDRSMLCRYLIEHGAEADIFMACALGDSDMATTLLDADSNLIDKRIGKGDYSPVPPAPGRHIYFYSLGDNKSPHQIARQYGHHRLYQMLLERSSPQRRFVAACERADSGTARALLEAYPDIVVSLSNQDQSILADAARENELEAVRQMLEAGFDPHVRCTNDSTPLHQAALHGLSEVVNLLLQYDPPLDDRNEFGARPLDMAVYGSTHSWRKDGDFPATVEALIVAGSEVDPKALPSGNDDVDAVLRRYLNEDDRSKA